MRIPDGSRPHSTSSVRALGSQAAEALFYQSSVAAVAGLVLRDGRRVVVKVHQPDEPELVLDELVRLQAHVAASRRFAPRPLAGPLRHANGFATIEEHDTRGSAASAHEPAVRRAIALSLLGSGVCAALRSRTWWLTRLAAVTRVAMTAAASRAPSIICSLRTAPSF
jgi:hypothetical protein